MAKNIFSLLILISFCTKAQKIDSLKLALKNAKNDTTRCNILNVMIETESDATIWSTYNEELKKIAETKIKSLTPAHPDNKNFKKYLSISLYNKGLISGNNGDLKTALEYCTQSLKIEEETGNNERIAQRLDNIGLICNNNGDPVKALDYYMKSLAVNKKTENKKNRAITLNNIGLIYYDLGNTAMAMEYYEKSIKIDTDIDDKNGIAKTFNNIALIYYNNGNLIKALEYFGKSIKKMEEIGDKQGTSVLLNNMATIYSTQGDSKKALEYFFKSLKLREETADKISIANSLHNIGSTYNSMGETGKAFEYYDKCRKIQESIGDKKGLASTLNSIGGLCFNQVNNLEKAIEYYRDGLKLREEIGDKRGIANSLNNIGAAYFKQKKYSMAIEYCTKSMILAKELGYPVYIKTAALNLNKIYKIKGDYKNALENYELYVLMHDSINNQETRKASVKSQLKYEFEKQAARDSVSHAKEKEITTIELEKQKTEINAKRNQQYALYGGLAVVLIFAGFMFNRFKVTQKQKNIIELKERETEKQNIIITEQKNIVEEKHKEITDSINYAERIQRSFLATKEMLDENLKDYFVYFQPKDVVSGDFYWADTLSDGKFALVTADSTGHGVPGAIMSLLNITSLENSIKQSNEPAEILNLTRKTIINRLNKDGSVDGGKDGMDCSIIVFDRVNNKLLIAVANNHVWIVRASTDSTTTKLLEVKPDKMPVGKHDRDSELFTQHVIDFQKGDIIYTLTDGFPDQFGGLKGKKFMSKNLKELLLKNAHLPMNQQKEVLDETFNSWKEGVEQVDDVTIIGIKI